MGGSGSGEREDHRGRQRPQRDGRDELRVAEENPLRLLAEVVLVHEQQVTEDAEEDEEGGDEEGRGRCTRA